MLIRFNNMLKGTSRGDLSDEDQKLMKKLSCWGAVSLVGLVLDVLGLVLMAAQSAHKSALSAMSFVILILGCVIILVSLIFQSTLFATLQKHGVWSRKK